MECKTMSAPSDLTLKVWDGWRCATIFKNFIILL